LVGPKFDSPELAALYEAVIIQRGIDAYRATGAEVECSIWAAMLVDVLSRNGRVPEALAVVDDALKEVARTGVRPHLAELHRLRGEALVRACAPSAVAQIAFERALEVARGQGAKIARAEGRRQLVPAVARPRPARRGSRPAGADLRLVHEGFDAPDLKEAKALLEVLDA
jgi:predicted ATPase